MKFLLNLLPRRKTTASVKVPEQDYQVQLTMSVNSIESTLNTLVCQVNYLASNINNLNTQISNLAESNESFRHQLVIEEALRNQETDIRLLKTKIEKTIEILQKHQNV